MSALTLTLSARSRAGREQHPTRDFFIRRLFRIAPMFWIGIVFYVWWYGTGYHYWAPDGIAPWMIVATATFLHGWTPQSITSVVPGGWSIALEATFYLALPLLLLWLRTLTRALWAVALTLLAALALGAMTQHLLEPLYPPDQAYLVETFVVLWFPAQLPVFCVGIALAFLIGRPTRDMRSASALAVGTACAAPLLLAFGGYPYLPADLLYAAAFALLAWGLAAVPWRILVNPVLRFVGLVSFSAYLVHFFVIDLVAPRVQAMGLTGTPGYLAVLVVSVPLTLAISSVTYLLVERPGIAAGRALITRLERHPAPEVPASQW